MHMAASKRARRGYFHAKLDADGHFKRLTEDDPEEQAFYVRNTGGLLASQHTELAEHAAKWEGATYRFFSCCQKRICFG